MGQLLPAPEENHSRRAGRVKRGDGLQSHGMGHKDVRQSGAVPSDGVGFAG